MSDRVFQDKLSIEVSGGDGSVEFYRFDDGKIMITVDNPSIWDSRRAIWPARGPCLQCLQMNWMPSLPGAKSND